MATYRATYKSVVINTMDIEADSREEAEELANEQIGEIDLYEGEVTAQDVQVVQAID